MSANINVGCSVFLSHTKTIHHSFVHCEVVSSLYYRAFKWMSMPTHLPYMRLICRIEVFKIFQGLGQCKKSLLCLISI